MAESTYFFKWLIRVLCLGCVLSPPLLATVLKYVNNGYLSSRLELLSLKGSLHYLVLLKELLIPLRTGGSDLILWD